jgi:hypothetical protein
MQHRSVSPASAALLRVLSSSAQAGEVIPYVPRATRAQPSTYPQRVISEINSAGFSHDLQHLAAGPVLAASYRPAASLRPVSRPEGQVVCGRNAPQKSHLAAFFRTLNKWLSAGRTGDPVADAAGTLAAMCSLSAIALVFLVL